MPPTTPRICVVGSSNMDLTFRTDRLPHPGETLTGQSFLQGFGGKGANQAVMAARMGAAVTMITRVGQDVFGRQIQENFRCLGIDITHVFLDELSTTGVASILVDNQGQNCIIVVPGANGALSPNDVRNASAAIRSTGLLLCQLEVPLATTLEAFQIARAAGVRTILNPAPAQPLPEELLRLTDLLIPNEIELELLAGKKLIGEELIEAAARELMAEGPSAVLVTMGEQGAMLVEENQVRAIPGERVQAVDTSGAGDAFIGCLAVYLAEGRNLAEAATQANCAAAFSVTRPGTQASFPARALVEAFPLGEPRE